MSLSNTATPRYYGEFREQVLRGEIVVCREISMQMCRIDDLILDPRYYYDDELLLRRAEPAVFVCGSVYQAPVLVEQRRKIRRAVRFRFMSFPAMRHLPPESGSQCLLIHKTRPQRFCCTKNTFYRKKSQRRDGSCAAGKAYEFKDSVRSTPVRRMGRGGCPSSDTAGDAGARASNASRRCTTARPSARRSRSYPRRTT